MEVEGMVTNTPCSVALFAGGGHLIRLAIDAQIHDVIPANGAVVDNDVPSPQSDGVPLLHFESLLAVFPTIVLGFALRSSSGGGSGNVYINIHVGHV